MKSFIPKMIFVSLLIMALSITATESHAQPFAYITNNGNATVSVIDTATNTLTTTISGFPAGPNGIAVTLDGSRAYVANEFAGSVSVIDTATNTIITTILGFPGAFGIAVNPSESRVYVANSTAATVSVINTATNTVITTIPVGSGPRGVVVTPDGSRVYVANFSSNNVSVINTTTNTVMTTIGVGDHPYGIAVTPDGSRIYVVNTFGSSISVINTSDNSVSATINLFLGFDSATPIGVAVTPDGSRVYVSHDNLTSGHVSVIDTTSNAVTPITIPGVTGSVGIAVTPDGSRVYTVNQPNNTISVIDAATNVVIGTPISGWGGADPRAFGIFIRQQEHQEEARPIPTMTQWGMIIFILFAGLGAIYFIRRQRREKS